MSNKKISDLPAAGAITGSELVELSQGGVSVKGTVTGIKNGAIKVYRALLTQAGVGAPTAVVLENTIGAIVWSYVSLGTYKATLAGAFPQLKTIVSPLVITDNDPPFSYLGGFWLDANTIQFYSQDNATLPVDVFDNAPVTLLVYP